MARYLSARGIRYAVLGITSFLLTFAGLQAFVPHSVILQNILLIGKPAGGVLADSGSACVLTKKDLKNDVFFVSCGGFF